MSRKILVGFGLILILGAVLTMLLPSRLLEQGTEAPAFDLMRLSDGERVSLESLRGKVVLIDFWSTSCPPCVRQMDVLESIHRQYEGRDVVVLGINTEPSNPPYIRDFVRRRGDVHYAVLLDGGATSEAYRVASLPTLYLIDRDGAIRWSRVGYTPQRELEGVVRELL